MKLRRDFLKSASLAPLGLLVSSAAGEDIRSSTSSDLPLAQLKPLTKVNPPQNAPDTDFGLLGTPPAGATLLGSDRPRNWIQVKEKLVAELLANISNQQADPVQRWLETFTSPNRTIDSLAAAALMPNKVSLYATAAKDLLAYEPQLYESSLRIAGDLLDRCLETRAAMSALEIAGVNVGLSYLTFVKLQLVQTNLIEQSNTEDIDQLVSEANVRSRDIYRADARKGNDAERVLLQGLSSEADGVAQQADLAKAKDHRRMDLIRQQFRLQSDLQLSQFASILTPGSATNYAERYRRLQVFLEDDLATAYSMLFSASKGLKTLLGKEVATSPRQKLDVEIPEFGIIDDLNGWIKKTLPNAASSFTQPDIIDALVLWCRAVMRELDRKSQYETEFNVAIPLSQIYGGATRTLADVSAAIAKVIDAKPPTNYIIPFTLEKDHMPIANLPANLRVVGVGLEVLHDPEDYLPLPYAQTYPKATVPGPGTPVIEPNADQTTQAKALMAMRLARINATVTTPPQNVMGVPYSRPKLFVTNVRVRGGTSGDLEPVITYDSACRNLSPYGEWSIEINRDVIADFAAPTEVISKWITGLTLHLRVRAAAV